MKIQVFKSNLGGDMGSFGKAEYRLFVQREFPAEYERCLHCNLIPLYLN